MSQDAETRFALYKLYLETAEKVSDRRAAANTWMLSVNSAVVGLYGWLGKDEGVSTMPDGDVWLWVVPASGILVCLAWAELLTSYRKLNAAKFKVLQELEGTFEYQPLTAERQYYRSEGRRRLSHVESWIPWSFALLYLCILGGRFFLQI